VKHTDRTLLALVSALALCSTALQTEDAHAQRRRRRNTRRVESSQPATTPSGDETSSGDSGSPSPADPQGTSAQTAASTTQDAPPPVASDTPAQSADAPTTTTTPGPAAIDVSAGVRWYGRFFDYHQDVFGELRGYALTAAPMLSASVEWYPGAHFSRGVASWFGLVAQGSFVVGVSSRDSRDMTYATTALSFDVGIRARVPVGLHDIGLHVTYGQQHFAIESNGGGGAGQTDPGVPGVQYQSVRVGASARLAASERVAILLGASGLPLLGAGDLATNYFRRATAAGVEAQLGLAIGLAHGVELRVLADARRYFFAMNPQVGDTWIAGGALDHHLSAGAAIAFRR
jgi:hypothetical protein